MKSSRVYFPRRANIAPLPSPYPTRLYHPLCSTVDNGEVKRIRISDRRALPNLSNWEGKGGGMEGEDGFVVHPPLIQFDNGGFSGGAIQARNKWPNKGLDETKGNVSFSYRMEICQFRVLSCRVLRKGLRSVTAHRDFSVFGFLIQ